MGYFIIIDYMIIRVKRIRRRKIKRIEVEDERERGKERRKQAT